MEIEGFILEAEILIKSKNTDEYRHGWWDKINRKVYKTPEIAKAAWNDIPDIYKNYGDWYRMNPRIVPLYRANENDYIKI